MKILAIDPGYERLGVAVIEKQPTEKEQLLFSECFKTKTADEHHIRLAQVSEEIDRVITEHQPDALAIETLFFSKNTKTALKVAEARGTIIATCSRAKLDVYEFSPQEIKIAVTGSGSSDKEHIMKMVPLLIRVPDTKKQDDEYDAIAVGLTFFATQHTIHR